MPRSQVEFMMIPRRLTGLGPFCRTLLFSLLLAAALAPALAQSSAARCHFQISVRDPAGALVTDATIALAPATQPGSCHLRVTHAGFAPLERDLPDAPPHATIAVVLQLSAAVDSVEVHVEGFKAESSSTATRIPLSLLDTPQTLTTLTSDLLRSRGSESMKSAVETLPAIGLQLGEGRRDNFFIRGFNAVSDMYLDGVRDTAQYYRDLSNTERIEVLEGPAAVLYGRGSSGGLINRVTKKPSLEGTLAELSYTAGRLR